MPEFRRDREQRFDFGKCRNYIKAAQKFLRRMKNRRRKLDEGRTESREVLAVRELVLQVQKSLDPVPH